MLTIRHNQIDTLRHRAIDDFRDRVCRQVIEGTRLVGRPCDAGTIAARVDREIAFARGFGFTRECDIARYVDIACLLVPDGVRPPKDVLKMLQDTRRSPIEKLDGLAARFAPAVEAPDKQPEATTILRSPLGGMPQFT